VVVGAPAAVVGIAGLATWLLLMGRCEVDRDPTCGVPVYAIEQPVSIEAATTVRGDPQDPMTRIAAQTYDAIALLVLGTDDSGRGTWHDLIRASTGTDTQCRTITECLKGPGRGQKMNYEGLAGNANLNAAGEPTSFVLTVTEEGGRVRSTAVSVPPGTFRDEVEAFQVDSLEIVIPVGNVGDAMRRGLAVARRDYVLGGVTLRVRALPADTRIPAQAAGTARISVVTAVTDIDGLAESVSYAVTLALPPSHSASSVAPHGVTFGPSITTIRHIAATVIGDAGAVAVLVRCADRAEPPQWTGDRRQGYVACWRAGSARSLVASLPAETAMMFVATGDYERGTLIDVRRTDLDMPLAVIRAND
jgi:hypothetical protein